MFGALKKGIVGFRPSVRESGKNRKETIIRKREGKEIHKEKEEWVLYNTKNGLWWRHFLPTFRQLPVPTAAAPAPHLSMDSES